MNRTEIARKAVEAREAKKRRREEILAKSNAMRRRISTELVEPEPSNYVACAVPPPAAVNAKQMVNQVNAFVTGIQNLTGDSTAKELVDFCKKWLEETAEKLSVQDLDRMIAQLAQPRYTAGHICVLIAKFAKIKTENDLLEFVGRMEKNVLLFIDVQIQWVADLYVRLFLSITDELLQRDCAIYGLQLLSNAILKLTNNSTTVLTNLHSSLFCLCLKSRRFDLALPFFQPNVIEVFNSAGGIDSKHASAIASCSRSRSDGSVSPNLPASLQPQQNADQEPDKEASPPLATASHLTIKLDTRCVLLYFYYGAVILCCLERYEEALLFLEHVICLPATRLSAIVLESAKKYVLVSLILGRCKPWESLPPYRSTVVQRQAFPLCGVYVKLAEVMNKCSEARGNVALTVENYLYQKEDAFRKDSNYGLAKRVLIAAKENAIKRLGSVFISLHLNEVSRLAHVKCNQETEDIVRNLCYRNEYNVKIDRKTETFRFDLEESEALPAINYEEVDAAMKNIVHLRALVSAFDDSVKLNPAYVIKHNNKIGPFFNNPGGPGPSGSGSGFVEDEGFHATSSAFSASPPHA